MIDKDPVLVGPDPRLMLALPPVIAAASFTEVLTTCVVLSTAGAAMPSLMLIVNVLVSVLPGATRFAVGVKTKARIAAVALAAVPLKV